MRRGAALVDWRRGVIAYVEVGDDVLNEFRGILELCGGDLKPRNFPCVSSLASRLKAKSMLYITDLYGITNSLAFSTRSPRAKFLDEVWRMLSEMFCKNGVEIECDEELKLECCKECGLACLLAKVLGIAHVGVEIDLRKQIEARLRATG